jgi:hypothetical protein
MIRTLTLVALLTLAAGGALGFFVAEARARSDATPREVPANVVSRKIEEQVRLYRQMHGDRAAEEIRIVLLDLDGKLASLLGRLRKEHRVEFEALTKEANGRIREILGASSKSGTEAR